MSVDRRVLVIGGTRTCRSSLVRELTARLAAERLVAYVNMEGPYAHEADFTALEDRVLAMLTVRPPIAEVEYQAFNIAGPKKPNTGPKGRWG
jgi:hypothetical protein